MIEKKYNESWHPVTYNCYGTEKLLDNPELHYTLLVNEKTKQFCVAYKLRDDNSWEQGHYFEDFYDAMILMYDMDPNA